MTAPSVVALTACPAFTDGREVIVSGLFDVCDHETPDPSAGIWSAGWLVVPHGQDVDDDCLFVDDFEFQAQVWPKAHGRALAQEREWDLCEQDREMAGTR